MDWLLEPFQMGFQQRALVGGLIAVVMCSVVGTWLVLRGMSFFGDAFVHGVLPGIALAVVTGGSPHLGAAVAAVVPLTRTGARPRTGRPRWSMSPVCRARSSPPRTTRSTYR